MKRLLIIAISALAISCATVQAEPTALPKSKADLTCDSTEGYEYYCYSDAECKEFYKGYAAIVKRRFTDQQFGWFLKSGPKQVVHVNLFHDHTGYKLIGEMVAEIRDNRIYIVYDGIICDLELNEVHSFHQEGFSNAIIKK